MIKFIFGVFIAYSFCFSGVQATGRHVRQDKSSSHASTDRPVTMETAKMVEEAVVASGVKSIRINSTTEGAYAAGSYHYLGQAVDIDMIDGYLVGDPRIRKKVRRLQGAFQEHANIYENFGPALQLRTEVDGTVVDKPKMVEEHTGHIHISGKK